MSKPVPLLGPHCVGKRVVVRRLLPGETGPTGGPALTDTIGVVEWWRDGMVRLQTEKGPVEFATATIESGKPIPPKPQRIKRPAPDAD